jgi:hypothetical protein
MDGVDPSIVRRRSPVVSATATGVSSEGIIGPGRWRQKPHEKAQQKYEYMDMELSRKAFCAQ